MLVFSEVQTFSKKSCAMDREEASAITTTSPSTGTGFFFTYLLKVVGGGGVVVVVVRTECSTRVSGHARTRMHLIGASAPVPSAGLTSRKPLSLFPTEAGSKHPQCKPHPTPRRGKILRGSPTSPPAREESRGCNIFHRLGVGCPT